MKYELEYLGMDTDQSDWAVWWLSFDASFNYYGWYQGAVSDIEKFLQENYPLPEKK